MAEIKQHWWLSPYLQNGSKALELVL